GTREASVAEPSTPLTRKLAFSVRAQPKTLSTPIPVWLGTKLVAVLRYATRAPSPSSNGTVESPLADVVGDSLAWLTSVRVGLPDWRLKRKMLLRGGPVWPALKLLALLRKATMLPSVLIAGLSEKLSAVTEPEAAAPLTSVMARV